MPYFVAIWYVGWKCLTIAMICVATAMLCKEQGITVTGVCAIYEIFVVQRVSFQIKVTFIPVSLFYAKYTARSICHLIFIAGSNK